MKKVVLVVDDTATVRSLAQYALTKAGYTVIEAIDGITGLAIVKAARVDLIISDINMPNMNGLDMVKEIKKDAKLKNIPIFFLTGLSNPQSAEEGKKLGVTGWIVKPFLPDKLLAAVNKILKGK